MVESWYYINMVFRCRCLSYNMALYWIRDDNHAGTSHYGA